MDTSETAEALIVRNIGDIESALAHAKKIDKSIWHAVETTLRDILRAPDWHVFDFDEEEGEVRFALLDWLIPGLEKPKPHTWLTVQEFEGLNGEYDETYLAEFMQVGPNNAGIALFFTSDLMQKRTYRKRFVDRDQAEISALTAAGFQIDNDHWIRFPIRLEVEVVAQGADDEDFAEALKPLKAAVNAATQSIGQFAALIRKRSEA